MGKLRKHGDARRGRDAERERHEIHAELEDHVERRARALESQGFSPADARKEARRRLGDREALEAELTRMAEQRSRRQAGKRHVETLIRDVGHMWRRMRARPALFTGVVLTIGLAIGAASAVFAMVNGVLLRPLAYPDAEALHSVYTRYLPATGYDFEFFAVSGPEYDDYREMTRAMSGVAIFATGVTNLAPEDGPAERVPVAAGSANLLEVLGVPPTLGRGFAAGEDAPGGSCVTVLSDGLWRERFGADSSIVGRAIRMDGRPCDVIGVMPRGFWFPNENVRLWRTFELDRTSAIWDRQSHPFGAVARLAPGSTEEAADVELASLRSQWSNAYPDHYERGHFMVLRPLRESMVGEARPALLTLFGAVGVVLLLVSVNLAGLLLSAADARRKEFAVRVALGVRRSQLVQQTMTESLVLAVLGGVVGIVIARGLLRGLLHLYPGGLPRATEIGVDGIVLLFGFTVAGLIGILFGIVPAVRSAGVHVHDVLRTSGRGLTLHRGAIGAKRVFIAAQAALALLLVVAATLLTQSYYRLRAVDLGFDAQNVLTFNVTVPAASYPDPASARDYFTRLESRLAALPGVVAAGAISDLPLRSAGAPDDFLMEGKAVPAPGQLQWNARYQMATPATLRALGLELVRGRWFEPTDGPAAPAVAVINEATERMYYAGEEPLGKRIRYYGDETPWITIVGVVRNVRSLGASEEAPPAIYAALAQAPRPVYTGRMMNMAVRFASNAAAGAPAIRAAVEDMDATLPASSMSTLESVVTESVGRPRFTFTLMTGFAGVALLLGALGLYGVLSHTVHQRLHEIAIRLALGARRAEVLRIIMMNGLVPVLVGTIVGLAASVALRRTLGTLLFGVSPLDPIALTIAVLTLIAVSVMACGVPGWRAMHVDPNTALRTD